MQEEYGLVIEKEGGDCTFMRIRVEEQPRAARIICVAGTTGTILYVGAGLEGAENRCFSRSETLFPKFESASVILGSRRQFSEGIARESTQKNWQE